MTAGLTVEKLREARRILESATTDPEQPIFVRISQACVENAIGRPLTALEVARLDRLNWCIGSADWPT